MLRQLPKGTVINLIGDPHLGRKFENGVPLHRRGEREQSQYDQFVELLNTTTGVELVIMMGDLFDQFTVNNDVVIQTYNAISAAALNNPDVTYYMLQGNHDVTRNAERSSSFDVLQRMLLHAENVKFVKEPEYHITKAGETILMFPYDEFTPAAELVRTQTFLHRGRPVDAVFGHWDILAIHATDNLIPCAELIKLTNKAYTGHIHTPTTFTDISGLEVEVTGSMQPYSHGEDPQQSLYVRATLAEYEKNIATDPKFYHDKCLKLSIKEGEDIPSDVDCLQFSVRFVDEDEKETIEVKMEVFSFKGLFDECMQEAGVPDKHAALLWDQYQEISRDAQNS